MKQTIYILCFLFLGSCTSRTIYKKPENLISKDQMIELWTEIYIANSASNIKNKRLELRTNYMPLVFEKYKIDSARFMESNVYYTSRIEEYERMFKKVEENIMEIKNKYDPDMEGIDPNLPIYIRDSIRKARKEEKNKSKAREIEDKLDQRTKIVD